MLRRIVVAALAAALIAPLYLTPRGSTTVLFSCPGIDSPSSFFGFDTGSGGGLSQTPSAQNAFDDRVQILDVGACSNGETVAIQAGLAHGIGSVNTRPRRPLGCPEAWGGFGPDYADQTPILVGGDPSFSALWFSDSTTSSGITKVKQGAAGDQWKVVFSISSGKYAPPAGMKTKMKFTADVTPRPGYSFSCSNDSDPLEYVQLASVGSVAVQQV
jgi:hypothetical protein